MSRDDPFDALRPTDDEIAAVQQPLPAPLRRQAADWTAPTPDEIARLRARQPGRLPRPAPRGWGALLVAAALLLSLRLVALPTQPPIVADAALSVPHGPMQLNPDIDAEGGGVLVVSQQSADGARVAVDDGAVTFTVDPNGRGRDLRVQAGPVEVRVTGTRFTVRRDAASGTVEVSVERGSVAVHAPDGVWAVRAGERWRWQPPAPLTQRQPPSSLPDFEPGAFPEAEPVREAVAPPSTEGLWDGEEDGDRWQWTPPAPLTQRPAPEAEPSTALFVALQDSARDQPPEAVVMMAETFLRTYPDSPFQEEVEVQRLEAVAKASPSEALAAVEGWLAANPSSQRRAEVLLLAGGLAEQSGGCAAALPYYLEVVAAGGPRLQAQARDRVDTCTEP